MAFLKTITSLAGVLWLILGTASAVELSPNLAGLLERQAMAGLAGLSSPPVSGNQSVITQYGYSNYVTAHQEGYQQSLNLTQTGSFNYFSLEQYGHGNKVKAEQTGFGNSAKIYQNGDFNEVNLVQQGSGNSAQIEQYGQSMSVQVIVTR